MKCSVALCTYNGEKFITEQLDSILRQTLQVDEIVICDDRSTDRTFEILREYQQKYPEKIRLYLNEENLRSVKNFEKAIRLCTNEIIFLSDQDDVWLPEKVETVLNYFEKNPETQVLATNGFGIDEDGNLLKNMVAIWDIPELLRKKSHDINYFFLIAFYGNIATGATMSLRREFLEEIIPFPIIETLHHDEWIALISSANSRFELINDKLIKYRIHQNQQVGNVFCDEKDLDLILKNYRYFEIEKSFSTYKYILKILSQRKRENSAIHPDEQYEKVRIRKIIAIDGEVKKHRADMKKKYPVKSFFLNITDGVTGKRKF